MEPNEIERLRAETDGSNDCVHFNNAGSSLPPRVVVDTMVHYLSEEARCGGYEMEARYAIPLENVYSLISRLLHARPNEIAVVENASMAWHLAFNGIDFREGDEVIISEMEYVTNFIGLLDCQQRRGIRVRVIPNDTRGNFDLDALESAVTPRTKLIAITHIASTAGNILPIGEIGRVARRNGILYLVDACQSVGQLPLDVEAIGCDMLSVTGRKYLRAPRGTGFLYVRKSVQDRLRPLLFDGHSITCVGEHSFQFRDDARRFELYEKNRALVLGLGAAVDYALALGLDRIAGRVQQMARLLREKLASIRGVTVHDQGSHLSGIVTFSVQGMDATAVKKSLEEKKINVSVAKAHSTFTYMNRHGLGSIVRASLHYYNTEAEIDQLCGCICQVLS
jgi:selenocysteine lyase/cysteine desulfurase